MIGGVVVIHHPQWGRLQKLFYVLTKNNELEIVSAPRFPYRMVFAAYIHFWTGPSMTFSTSTPSFNRRWHVFLLNKKMHFIEIFNIMS